MSKYRNFFFCAAAALLLTNCAWLGTEQIGDAPDAVRVNAIKSSKHTKEDVIRLLGTPTSVTLFEKESWLYIESNEQNRLFLPQEEISRRVIKITFDKNGKVAKVKKLSLADGQKIEFDKETTHVSGKDLSIFDELIGNFGRFPANKAPHP